MILFARDWNGPSWADRSRALASLGLFAGGVPSSESSVGDLFAHLPAPRVRAQRGWRVARSRSGWPALLSGWIDNQAELAAELGLAGASVDAATLYAEAVERWGARADARIIGSYCAVTCLPDGRVRLARSPWGGKSLLYHDDGAALLVCSIARPLFAAGLEKRLRPGEIDALVSMRLPDDRAGLFEGIWQVPHGAVVTLSPGRAEIDRWYDPQALGPVRLRRDADYVEAANALLRDAVGHALGAAQNPAMTLSGGLDSSMVCAEALAQLAPGKRLKSFTFHPLAEWDGAVPAHKFGDDRPLVEQFARMHPGLDPQFVDNRGIAFDDRAAQVFAACDAGYPARVLGSLFHGIYDAAARAQCDWLLTAECGNLTFSNGAPWAAAEFFRSLRWSQLWQLLGAVPADPRPMWRRIAAQGLMPQLPARLRAAIRAAVHRGDQLADRYANPFLRADSRLGELRREAAIQRNIMTVDRDESRAAYIAENYHAMSLGGEVIHGYEQVFGIRLRDVTAYRPLIEFCLSVPTDQLVRDGESRWLARRMAQGRMPEAQRRNRLYGEHNADWHARLTPRLGELRREAERLADHPQLAEVIDIGALRAALDDWPATTPANPVLADRLRFHLPAVLYIGRFLDFETGRNPQ